MFSKLLQLTRSQNGIVGLDIDSDYIKVLKIKSFINNYQVEKFGISPLPPGAIVKTEIKDSQVVADTLRTALHQANINTSNMALAISRSSTIIKNITIDSRLTPEEIETRAWIEANHHFPDLVGDSYLDFSIMGTSAKDPSQLELLLVACRKEVVDPYLNLLNQVGVTPKIVDVNSYALERALVRMVNSTESKTTALLNLNSSLSTLIVIQDNKLIYAHDESFDAKRLQTQYREAGSDKDKQQQLLKENLSAHLRHTMHFFYSTRSHVAIDMLLVGGDCAKDIDLIDFIQNETGLKTQLAEPLANMTINSDLNQDELKKYSPALVLCTGLALSQIV